MSTTITKSQHHCIKDWLQSYSSRAPNEDAITQSYFTTQPQTLISSAKPLRFSLGNGHQLISSISDACLENLEHELIFVTCFWAKSSSRDAMCHLLRMLSEKGRSQNRRIQVRICFSSRSIVQKLFQTSSLNGKTYPPNEWKKTLGLPDPEELMGLNLVVKCIFVRPFSVMHPKFVLIDRQKAFMPSCNVSWESWFEGSIEMEGDICAKLYEFWSNFWVGSSPPLDDSWTKDFIPKLKEPSSPPIPDFDLINYRNFEGQKSISTILLPSPHHANPRFSPFSTSIPPSTPLNTFVLSTINSAKRSIHIQTPNLTCRSVIRALLLALARGVDVTIITSSLLMIPEQLVTAFTITEFETWKLRRRHNKLLTAYSTADSESQATKPGTLKIGYYHARVNEKGEKEPVKSHLKLTIVDEEVTVLGSGNMDRASFFTSQELGVALLDEGFAREVWECTDGGLLDRVSWV